MSEVFDVHQQWLDKNTGALLIGGRVYYGKPNTDPKILANQISIFSNRARTIALPNPQTIGIDGRVENKPWLGERYSIQVDDVLNVLNYSDPDNGESPSSGQVLALSNVQGINTLTAETSVGITAYNDQQIFTFETVATNTSNMTLDVDGIGPRAIKFNFVEEIKPGFFQAGQMIEVIYSAAQDNFSWANAGRGISLLTNVAGDGNTITADGGPSITGYVDQQLYQFKPNITNGGDVTLKVGSLPTVSCKDKGAEIRPEQFKANGIVIVSFNSVGPVFEVINNQDVGITLDTPKNTTSGNLVTFTGLLAPKKVIIMFNGVSLSDGSDIIVRLNDQGSSTYISSSAKIADALNPEVISATTSFIINTSGAGEQFFGQMLLTLFDPLTNLWIATHTGRSSPSFVITGGGSVTLTAILSSIAIRSAGGPFDNGSVNIQID